LYIARLWGWIIPIIFKAGFCGLGALFAASLEAEAVESAIMGKMEAYAMSNE
jgi:hypothetical protein